MEQAKVLEALETLEIVEMQGGEDAYILVDFNNENRETLHAVGVTDEMMLKYGDESSFCILALAYNEKLAVNYKPKTRKFTPYHPDPLQRLKTELEGATDNIMLDNTDVWEVIEELEKLRKQTKSTNGGHE